MSNLVPPHGSDSLKPLLLPETERAEEARRAERLTQVPLSSREVSDLFMLGMGAYTPLDGFMGEADWRGCCEHMTLANGIFWPIPITLSCHQELGDSIGIGEDVALVDGDSGELLGILAVEEKYGIDREFECSHVFRTTDTAHPGVDKVAFTGSTETARLINRTLAERDGPIGVLIAATGTVYLGWFLGTPPWISLSLAFSFGLYGLVRKVLGVGPMTGMLWETLLLALPAALYIAWAFQRGTLGFGHLGVRTDWLLVLAGLVTVLPLVWFNVAARNLKLSTVGFFQYIAPSMTFLLSVFLYNEPFTQGHAVAFTCIWLALAMVSVETILRSRRLPVGRA